MVEELSVTPFDTSRLRKHLGQPSNVGESEKTKRTSISEVINTMQIHRSSQSMTCGGMLTSNINLRRPDLNSPIKIGTVFYSNQHNESTLPIDITAKLSTQLEESKPPSGFLPTASIIENQDNVSNESRRDRSPYVDCVPQGSSLSGNTFLGATMSSDSSHENNRQTPAIAPGSLSMATLKC